MIDTCLKASPSNLPAFLAVSSIALAFVARLRIFTKHDTKHTNSSNTSNATRAMMAMYSLGNLYAEKERETPLKVMDGTVLTT